MINLNVVLNGDGFLKGFPPEQIVHLKNPITVTTLEGGMVSGLPSAAFIFDLPDGRKVFAETSVRLLLRAADIIKAKYGSLEDV